MIGKILSHCQGVLAPCQALFEQGHFAASIELMIGAWAVAGLLAIYKGVKIK